MPAVPVAIGIGWVLRVVSIPLVLAILKALGIGFAVFTGMNLLLDAIENAIKSAFQAPEFQTAIDLLVYMNMDDGITIILSAISVRMAIIGFDVAGKLTTFRLFTGTL